MSREFQIIPKNWYKKKRLTGEEVKPVHVAIPNYQAIHDHTCTMITSYSDGTLKRLKARVLYNDLSQQWTVDGVEVAVIVVETVANKNDFSFFDMDVG